jgi:hypothetical protein
MADLVSSEGIAGRYTAGWTNTPDHDIRPIGVELRHASPNAMDF